MKTLLREPIVHFLLLGGVLLFAQNYWAGTLAGLWPSEHIVVSNADRERLRDEWLRETGRAPSAAELDAMVQAWIDEELLFREAKRLGLHERDPVVKQRLVRNMRFATQDQNATPQALLEAAIALGMVDSDLVVRRRLVQRMRHRLESAVRVTEADLQDYYGAHQDSFRRPARLAFEHLFFSPDRRGAQAQPDAVATLAALQAGDNAQDTDPFLLGTHFDAIRLDRVERQFGTAFAEALHGAKPGQWLGPVRSSYGFHLVRVKEQQPATTADYASVRRTALARLYARREQASIETALKEIRRRYRIQVGEETS